MILTGSSNQIETTYLKMLNMIFLLSNTQIILVSIRYIFIAKYASEMITGKCMLSKISVLARKLLILIMHPKLQAMQTSFKLSRYYHQVTQQYYLISSKHNSFLTFLSLLVGTYQYFEALIDLIKLLHILSS